MVNQIGENDSIDEKAENEIKSILHAHRKNKDDKYGFQKLVAYVKEKNRLKDGECEREYIRFIRYYCEQVLEYRRLMEDTIID